MLAGQAPRKDNVNIAVNTPNEEPNDLPMFALLAGAIGDEPRTLAQALASPDAHKWKEAYQIELNQLSKLRTLDIVERPHDKPIIPCGYIFKIKLTAAGEVLKYKARVVAGGHRQKKGVNYDETFAAAAKIASIRVLLALAAQCDWEIDQIDVISAYLNADLKDEVYMEAPSRVLDDGERGKVCRLRKGLYGLKQAGCRWYDCMAHTFTHLGFNTSKLDQSVFIRTKRGEIAHVSVSTDDMIVMGNTRATVDGVKRELRALFDITDQGELSWLLGFEVQRNRPARTLALNQKVYIEALAKHFEL